MQFIPTNDCFRHIVMLLQLHQDKDFIIEIFASRGWDISKAKLKSWMIKTGQFNKDYREMPREALDDFIGELYDRKLVTSS